MKLLEGRKIADKILAGLKSKISDEKAKPGLAVILVGDDEASEIYIRLKEKAAKKVGIGFHLFRFSEKAKENEIVRKIKELNQDKKISGIIVQLPLPAHLDKQKIIGTIDPCKDVDGFHPENKKAFFESDFPMYPPFPRAIIELIKSSGGELKNKKGIVICNSEDFGRTMQAALEKARINAEYILKEKIWENIERIKSADVIVTACGIPKLINGTMVKDGVILLDGGISKLGGRTVGDVDLGSVENMSGFVSPVPGGVGPVTVACLLENTHLLAKKSS